MTTDIAVRYVHKCRTLISQINLLLLACSNFHITCFFADVNECEQFRGMCEFPCVNTIGSFECRCPGGGVLNPDQRTCSGVDGCALENLKCEQQCDFSVHGYKCSCVRGYLPAANQQDCMWMSAYQTIQTRASLSVSTLLVVTSASAQLDITSVLTARNVKT